MTWEHDYPAAPNWDALEAMQGAGDMVDADDFMYMGSARCIGVTIHLYKHIDTRRYLNLDEDGQAWSYASPGYIRCEIGEAVRHAYS